MKRSACIFLLILLVAMNLAACDSSENDSAALLVEAAAKLVLAEAEPGNLSRVLFYSLQTIEVVKRIRSDYPNTEAARKIEQGGLPLNDMPYAEWEEQIEQQVALFSAADSDLWAFTYAITYLGNEPLITVFIGQRYADAGRIEQAKAIWQTAETILTNSPMPVPEKSPIYEALAAGKVAVGLYDEAARAAQASGSELLMARIAGRMDQAKNRQAADALLDVALQSVRDHRKSRGLAHLSVAVLREAGIRADHPEVKKIVRAAMEGAEESSQVRLNVERLSAIAYYLRTNGQIEQGDAFFDQALSAVWQEEKSQRRVALVCHLAKLEQATGRADRAAAALRKGAKAVEGILEEDRLVRDKLIAQLAGYWAQQGDFSEAERLLENIGNREIRYNTAAIVAERGKQMQLLADSLELAQREEDLIGQTAILSDMAGFYAAQDEKEKALALWSDALRVFRQFAMANRPTHGFIDSEHSKAELHMRSLMGMFQSVEASFDEQTLAEAFEAAWPLAMAVALGEKTGRRAEVLAMVSQFAPRDFPVDAQTRFTLNRFLFEQRYFFVELFKATRPSTT